MSNIALVLLAAGRPSRHAAETAIASGCDPVLVVLGSHIDETRAALDGLDVVIVENTLWKQGIGTSIRAGISGAEILGSEGAILALADQPLVSAGILRHLIEEHEETGRPIIASEYAGAVGIPAFFTREFFPKLKALYPGEGCEGVILAHLDQSIRIACPEAEADIDTAAEYRAVIE